MSHMKKLLESMTKYSASESINEEEYCDSCDRVKSKCICDDDLAEALMNEYRDFVPDVANEEGPVDATSPVANINPRSRNQQHMVDEADVDPVTGAPVTPTPGQPTKPAVPGQQQTAPGQPAKPGQQTQPTNPAAPGGQAQQVQQGQQQATPGQPAQPAPVTPQQTSAMTQLKTATGNTKLNPAKAAAAASVVQQNPQGVNALNPDQKAQMQQLGASMAPIVNNPQNIAKIKSMMPAGQAQQQPKV